GPELRALAAQLTRIRQESAVLERERRSEDRVDFLAVARLAEAERTVDRACLDSTQRLVAATATVMTPEQRQLYFQYVQPAPSSPAAWLASPEPAPNVILQQDELVGALRKAVDSLSHDLRTTLLLHHYEQLSYREISAVLGCSEKGIETRLYRARLQLRAS